MRFNKQTFITYADLFIRILPIRMARRGSDFKNNAEGHCLTTSDNPAY